MDYETLGGDDMIGHTKIKVSALCVNGGIDEWFRISFNGREAGSVRLRSVWRPLIIPTPTNVLIGIGGQVINSVHELERQRAE